MGKTIAIFFVFLFSLMILPVGEGRATDGFSVVVVSIVRNAAGLCDKAFDPPVIKISSGTTVVWANKDIVTHTLVSAEGEDPCGPTLLPIGERAIDGGQIMQGKSYQMTFNKPGTYFYMCHLPTHQMRGKIVVTPR